MLVDTDVIIRSLQKDNPDFKTAVSVLDRLKAQGRSLSLASQNLVEIWAVATRPKANRGLGLTTEDAAAELKRLKGLFNVLAESGETYDVWESLVIQHRLSGKATHDARLVAAMQVHRETSILTFNTADFKRFSGMEVIHPAEVLSPKAER